LNSVESAPRVYVITLNWNGRRWLGACLESALAMDYPNFKVLMVDNGSTDGSVEFVRDQFPAVQVVANLENLGYSRGFNSGLSIAAAHGAAYFLIMNNDTKIDPHALAALVETAQSQPKAGFVSGKVYFHDRPNILQTTGKLFDPILWNGKHIGAGEEDKGQYDKVAECPFLDDIFTLVDRALYDQTGGYDPQLFLNCEEFDWQIRAKKLGWKLYYTPYAKLWHYGSLSMGGLGSPISQYFFIRNHLVVMARHATLRQFLSCYRWLVFDQVRSLASGFVRRASNINSRFAGLLGIGAATLWLIHRRPATRIPWIIRQLARAV
jgi:GT2 family glycosyltransferase